MIELLISLIWSFLNIYMYQNIRLYLISMFNYYLSIKNANVKLQPQIVYIKTVVFFSTTLISTVPLFLSVGVLHGSPARPVSVPDSWVGSGTHGLIFGCLQNANNLGPNHLQLQFL